MAQNKLSVLDEIDDQLEPFFNDANRPAFERSHRRTYGTNINTNINDYFSKTFGSFVSSAVVATNKKQRQYYALLALLIFFCVISLVTERRNVLEYSSPEHIRNWCIDERKDDCLCDNPFRPTHRAKEGWTNTFAFNVEQAKAATATDDLDIVFLGDSHVEGWRGTSLGRRQKKRNKLPRIFASQFRKETGGEFHGLALGITGDKSPNLLWRIQNGEIPPNLHPKVWWIVIGTNDFRGKTPSVENVCSKEVVLSGILQVVKTLRSLRPNAIIVVNGVLPKGPPEHPDGGVGGKPSRIWSAIDYINDGLRLYCEREERLHFFDAKHIFLEKDEVTGKVYIAPELMRDLAHPTPQGYKLWADMIAEELRHLIH